MTEGETELADTETERLIGWLAAIFEARTGVDLTRTDDDALRRLRAHVVQACAARTVAERGIAIDLPFLTSTFDLHEALSAEEVQRIFDGGTFSDKLDAARAERARAKGLARAARNVGADGETRKAVFLWLFVVALVLAGGVAVLVRAMRAS